MLPSCCALSVRNRVWLRGSLILWLVWMLGLSAVSCLAQPADTTLVNALRQLATDVYSSAEQPALRDMLRLDIRRRLQAANDRSSEAWRAIQGREEWEAFVRPRREALEASLGLPDSSPPLQMHVTRTLTGDGFTIDNVLFASRPDVWITANLYRPSPSRESMPGIVICHSHHTAKTHGELQDMGMTWARLGCMVLVPDLYGYGERRAHPFHSAADYRQPFAVSRQDYYFRYDNGMQLHLAGESLMGQIVWDLRRSVDLLMSQPGVDASRIALLGSVAGGGDPAAVTGLLDPRIAVVVPFNFGGPQPETRYPLPEDVETSFQYAGSGSWESTRNLRNSARDGFLPWVIVGGIAPRGLVYAHEFNWHRERDPVWKRLQQIYDWYEPPEKLAFTFGSGEVTQSADQATHCTHIGRVHRRSIHAALAQWFRIEDGTDHEYSQRVDSQELRCWTEELRKKLREKPVRAVAAASAAQAARRSAINQPDRRSVWKELLGDMPSSSRLLRLDDPEYFHPDTFIVRAVLAGEREQVLPLVVLQRDGMLPEKRPAVVMIAQAGKQQLLRQRAVAIATLIAHDVAVCLPDLRGIGETRPDDGRERRSSSTSLSSSELMLGDHLVGARVRDLASVVHYLRSRNDIDADRIVLWGDSLAGANASAESLLTPHAIDERPAASEPLGGIAALLGAAAIDDVKAVYVRGGLTSYASALQEPMVLLPHDVVIPGVLTKSDLPELASALSPLPIRFDAMVDGLNRRVPSTHILGGVSHVMVGGQRRVWARETSEDAAEWVLRQLR